MKIFGKTKPTEPSHQKTTAQNLKDDGAQTLSGAWNFASGLTKTGWHTYTGVLKSTFSYLANHPNQSGIIIAATASGYLALQNDTISEHADNFFGTVKAQACQLGLDEVLPSTCDELALIEVLRNSSFTNG